MRVDATALRREAQAAADEIARNPDVRDHVAHDVLDELGASAKHMGAPGLVVAALDDERRQTQRRMIAALYWRAGEWRADDDAPTGAAVHITVLLARLMEAACAR